MDLALGITNLLEGFGDGPSVGTKQLLGSGNDTHRSVNATQPESQVVNATARLQVIGCPGRLLRLRFARV